MSIPYGLRYVPSFGSDKANNSDKLLNYLLAGKKLNVTEEFSPCNREVLLRELATVPENGVIVEVGIARNGELSSTCALINNRLPGVKYIGIDIKTYDYPFLNKPDVHVFQMDSSDTATIMQRVWEISGKYTIDLLHIDGWHSVNQILRDWLLIEYLAPNGVALFHDTNYHPGPTALFASIDTRMFTVKKYCENEHDYGIGVVRRL